MPHVAFVPFVGLRVRDQELLKLGMELPGLPERASALSELPALGVLTLAGMLPEDWTCSYHDAASLESNEARLALCDEIIESKPTIVALSALTASVMEAYRFAELLKNRETRTVLGGLHATVCPDEAAKYVDCVVVGEGESVWPELLQDATVDELKPKYVANGNFDLSLSPLPRFDLLGNRDRPRMTLQTQRGCPFSCEFCAASRLLGSFREKPVDNIRAELAAMRELLDASSSRKKMWLELADDNTFAGARDWRPLLDALGGSGARYFTESDWRIGEDAELVEALAASGCVQVLVGVESMHFRYPGMGTKASELDRMIEATERLQAAGVVVNGCFILGAEGETEASIDRLIEFIQDSPFAEVQITLQTPFPGTALYERLAKSGRLLPRDWSYYTLFDVTYRPDSMTPEELEQGFRRALTSVFSKSQNRKRQIRRKEIWRLGGQFASR